MKFLTAIQFLSTVFPALVVCDQVMAAQPFTIGKSGVTSINAPVTGASCQDYNNQLAGGVTLNGINHPNFCQFSSAQIVLNGLPFEQYWQAVSSGAVPPPYQVRYKSHLRRGMCASTFIDSIKIEVSMHIPTSRLIWSGAASVGPSCSVEWIRHSSVTLASDTANVNTARSKIQQLVSILNSAVQKQSFESCAEVATVGETVQKETFIGLAAAIKNFMSNDVNNAQTSWSPLGVSGNDCNLFCNVCSSGWAGTLTCTQQGTGTDGSEYHETQNWHVGGTSGTTISASWTANGGGTAGAGGGWTTNNASNDPQFKVDTDPMGNISMTRPVLTPPIPKGIVGFGGANPATDYEYFQLPPMKTMHPSDTAIPFQFPNQPLPYTSANNGPTIASPSGSFSCHGAMNLQ